MASKILIRNAKAIVTCDSRDQVYRDSDLLVEGPKILAIGNGLEAEGAQVIDGRADQHPSSFFPDLCAESDHR